MTKDDEFAFRLRLEQELEQEQKTTPTTSTAADPYNASPEYDAASGAWETLQVPSQMSRRGLDYLAGAVPKPEPTGNLPLDLARGAPRIAAETVAEGAPKFIDRMALLMGGAGKVLDAARPLGSMAGRAIAGEAESLTGSVPGSLRGAWNDATLMFGKGKAAAGPSYELAKTQAPAYANLFEGMYKAPEIIDKAKEYIAKGGVLEPTEALIYRKAIDAVAGSRNIVKDVLYPMRDTADAMAKESPAISEGDRLFQRALQSESLRRLVPQNKYGGSSAFKMALMAFLHKAGGPLAAGLLSPALHGLAATGGGLAAKIFANPAAATATGAAYASFIDKYTTGKDPETFSQ